jgi:rhamnogalacturonyl hydrolase YesR
MLVPKEYNAKGIALFLQGYCSLYKVYEDNKYEQRTILSKINYLAEMLISMKAEGYSGACWGYNFDWQARKLFLFPKNTPTVVVTTFCAEALIKAYEITRNDVYLSTVLTTANFVLHDLHRTKCANGFLFSYSPLRGNDTVFNASLLGSKLLSLIYSYTQNDIYMTEAKQSIIACCEMQSTDGSWPYGILPIQNWIDSFHTGYNLECLNTYQTITGDFSFDKNIQKGLDFYLTNFFEKNGSPKYYYNKLYPIDIHCPAQLIITLYKLNKMDIYKGLIEKVLRWMIVNMQSPDGYFYYQIRKNMSSKISYMRWNNAFVFSALSYCLFNEKEINHIKE